MGDLERYIALTATVLGILGYLVNLAFTSGRVKFQVDQMWRMVTANSQDLGQAKFQIEQLWKVIFANAQVELVSKGLAEIKSPIRIVSEGYEFIRPHLNEYMPIYHKVLNGSKGLADGEVERRLFQAFSMEASESIIQQVCLPKHLPFGAGVMAVIQACQWASAQGGT